MSDPARQLLRRLEVFAGGWTTESAEAICAGDGLGADAVRATLTELADEGLLLLRDGRWNWATGRQGAPPADHPVLARHRDYFLALAEEAEAHLSGPAQGPWLERLEAERGNFNRALRWCLERPGEGELGLRLASALARFWWMRGHGQEGQRWLEEVLGRPDGADALRARALQGAGAVAYARSDFAQARSSYEQALTILRRLGDQQSTANLLNLLGMVAREQADYAAARSYHEQALASYRALGRDCDLAGALNNLGVVALLEGLLEQARKFHEEALAVRRNLGDERGIASSLSNLGNVARACGDGQRARALHEESLAIRRRLGDRWGMGASLLSLGALACAAGDDAESHRLLGESRPLLREVGDRLGLCEWLEAAGALAVLEGAKEKAVRLFAAAARGREELRAPLPRGKSASVQAELERLRAALGEQAFTAAWAAGQAEERIV
jgi:tetratricopeptide (TPR) repeat protein